VETAFSKERGKRDGKRMECGDDRREDFVTAENRSKSGEKVVKKMSLTFPLFLFICSFTNTHKNSNFSTTFVINMAKLSFNTTKLVILVVLATGQHACDGLQHGQSNDLWLFLVPS